MTHAVDKQPAAAGWRRDEGFTLAELMVSLMVVALVGTFAASAHLASLRATRVESDRQVAAQLLTRELDRVRGMGGSAAAESRTEQISGLAFGVDRTVVTCWQVLSTDGRTPTCAATEAAGSAEMVHVVVAVSWRDGERTYTQRGDVTVNADPVFPV